MKSVYIVSWLLALAVSFVSCDDWLDKTPKDRLYPDVYFKTEDELRLFTNQFYNNLIPAAADIYSESSDLIVKSDLMLEMSGQRIIPTRVTAGILLHFGILISIYSIPTTARM